MRGGLTFGIFGLDPFVEKWDCREDSGGSPVLLSGTVVDNLVDKAVFSGLGGTHEIVTLGVLCDLLD